MKPWRCSECGCSRREADRKRKLAGLPPLASTSVACSPACSRERERRRLWERYGPGTRYYGVSYVTTREWAAGGGD